MSRRKNATNTIIGAVASAIFGLASPANAVIVGPINFGSYTGPVTIQFNGVTTESNTPYGTPGAGTEETTFGAAFITSAFQTGNAGNSFYNIGGGGDHIGVLIYGIADAEVTPGGTGVNIFNTGCTGGPCDGKIHVDLYLKPNATTTDFGGPLAVANRTAFDQFTGITDGTLFMKWELVPGIITTDNPAGGYDERNATLFQDVSASTLPATGSGRFYAECVSGFGCPTFENNFYPNLADFFGRFTLSGDLVPSAIENGWAGNISDPVETRVVPEPGTLAFFSVGLITLMGLSRKRKQRNS